MLWKCILKCASIVVILCGALIVASFLVSPSATSLRDQAAVTDNPLYDSRLVNELGNENLRATLIRKHGDYYDFALSPKNGEGGIEMIVYMKGDDRFEQIWSGQDSPPCAVISRYAIPPGIAPYCLDGVLIDRSNPVRVVYSWLFNHVDIARQLGGR
jgi:hypothetical protein